MERHAEHFTEAPPRFPIASGREDSEDRLDGGHYQQHQHKFIGQQNNSNGHNLNGNHSRSAPLSGRKRLHPHPNINGDFVKLYVVGVPRAATEEQIRAVFGELGQIVEVVLLKDKVTGIQRECCFVKYATLDQAEMAMVALNSQFTFPGATIPMKVKFADGERERLGSTDMFVHKLYVGSVNREASKWEIEEIFSPFGVVEEVFIVRDEFKQNRGYAFVQFLCRDMAIAAIQALHGTYVMKGCELPLIVRFADPRKPRMADSSLRLSSSHSSSQAYYLGSTFSTPAPLRKDHPSNAHAISNKIQQMKSSDLQANGSISKDTTPSPSASHASDSIAVVEPPIECDLECDWSEHVSPDGELYYYNCETCESRWEKPEEYALYEQELHKLETEQAQHEGGNKAAAGCVRN